MGCPVSRFGTLYELATNKQFKQEFNQFKQIAIVLNDPRNARFKKTLQENFVRLDKETGKSFLFISFVNRPHGWEPGFDLIEDGKKVLAADYSMNNASQMYTFCQRADIATHNLPKILLLENFDATEYVAIPTDTRSICNQLVTIGRFCDEQNEGIPASEMAKFLKREIPNQPISIGMTAEPISTILTDLYAASVPKRDEYHDQAQRRQIEARERLYNSYQNASDEDKEHAMFNWMNYEAYCENNKRRRERKEEAIGVHRECYSAIGDWIHNGVKRMKMDTTIQEPYPQDNLQIKSSWIKGCECDSVLYIKWFNELGRKNLREHLLNIPTDKTLYSRYLTKFLEKELNYSLVQHMRQVMGIPMPEYYCEYYKTDDPDKYDVSITKKYSVSLNFNLRQFGDRCLSIISAGSVARVYQKMLNEGDNAYHMPLKNYGQDFIETILRISPSRNIGEHHDDLYNPEAIEYMYVAFVDFLRDYFPQLIELKRQLRQNYR